MKTTKLMAGLALVASTLLTTAPVLAQDLTKKSNASFTIKAGDRTINDVPTIDFGNVTILGSTAAPSINSSGKIDPIKLSDCTGSLAGWQLKVKKSAFEKDGDSSKTLDGVKLTLTGGSFDQSSDDIVADDAKDTVKNVVLSTVGHDEIVATAGEGTGSGATTINYDGATLELPDITKKVKVGTYSSELTWTLTDAPTD